MCEKDVETVRGYAKDPSAEKTTIERMNRVPPPGTGSGGSPVNYAANSTSRQIIWTRINEHEHQIRAYRALLGMLPAELTADQDYNLQVLLRK